MSTSSPQIRITADEINCLIYAYLRDSGFAHSAYLVCQESKLERSPYFQKHIPRGELIELLSKALLYIEVENHWKENLLTTDCKSGFSLLEQHVCSPTPPSFIPIPVAAVPPLETNSTKSNTLAVPSETNAKRKVSPVASDGPAEKRSRKDEEKEQDSGKSSKFRPSPHLPEGPIDPYALVTFPAHDSEVFVCAFNPVHHAVVATGSKDAVVKLWELPDPSSGSTKLPKPPIELKFKDREGKDITSGGDLTALHWNSEGSLLAIGSYDSLLRVCTSTGEMYLMKDMHTGPIFASRFSPSGRWLASASLDGTVCLWDIKTKRIHKRFQLHDPTECCLDVDWITDEIFATCSANGQIHILRTNESDPLKVFSGHKLEVNRIKCNGRATRLASCSDDGTARIWNLDLVKADVIPGLNNVVDQPVVLNGHRHSVTTVAWCPNQPPGTNEMIATSSFDGTARFWDTVTGECLHVFKDHRRSIYALVFSPDGKWLATGSGDGFLYIYHVETREKRWSWFAGVEKPGVFEIDWQQHTGLNRITLALECRQLAVIDVTRVPELQLT